MVLLRYNLLFTNFSFTAQLGEVLAAIFNYLTDQSFKNLSSSNLFVCFLRLLYIYLEFFLEVLRVPQNFNWKFKLNVEIVWNFVPARPTVCTRIKYLSVGIRIQERRVCWWPRLNVETHFKVVNRKADGNPGKVAKLTINCYHATWNTLIIGRKVDFFAKEGLLLLNNRLSLLCNKLDSLNAEFEIVIL